MIVEFKSRYFNKYREKFMKLDKYLEEQGWTPTLFARKSGLSYTTIFNVFMNSTILASIPQSQLLKPLMDKFLMMTWLSSPLKRAFGQLWNIGERTKTEKKQVARKDKKIKITTLRYVSERMSFMKSFISSFIILTLSISGNKFKRFF